MADSGEPDAAGGAEGTEVRVMNIEGRHQAHGVLADGA